MSGRRTILGSLRRGAARGAARAHLLGQIEAIWGPGRVDDALRLAIEAGKYALQTEQIGDLLREHAFLELAGALPKPGEGFVVWALRTGLTTQEQIDEGRALDLLAMRSEGEGEDG